VDPIRGEAYAESRFGAPPARGGYLRQEVDEEDAQARITNRVSRAQGLGETVAEFDSYARRGGAARGPAALRSAQESGTGRQGIVEMGASATLGSATPELPGDAELSPLVKRKGVQEVALIASDSGFFPKTVFVTRDIPVRLFITGASKQSGCLLIDAFQVRKQVRPQKIEEVTFTAAVPGRYRFYCPINGAEGTLVVKEFGAALQRLAGASEAE